MANAACGITLTLLHSGSFRAVKTKTHKQITKEEKIASDTGGLTTVLLLVWPVVKFKWFVCHDYGGARFDISDETNLIKQKT